MVGCRVIADVERVDYIRFDPDYDADLSYLSETEAEYEKNGPVLYPTIRIPGADAGRGLNGATYQLVYDPETSETVRHGGHYVATVDGREVLILPSWIEMPWHEYRQTYGAAENYESFVALACRTCECCGGEIVVDSVYGCDFYGGNGAYDGGHAMPEVGRKYRTRRELAADGAEWVAEHFVGFDRGDSGDGAGDRTRFVLLRSFAPENGYVSNWEVVRQSSDAEYLRSFAAGHFQLPHAADYAGVRFVVVDTLGAWVAEEVTA